MIDICLQTLRQINNMVNANPAGQQSGKRRLLQEDSETTEIILGFEGPSPPKKHSAPVSRNIQNLIEDRRIKSQSQE
jgi:hypothetical protein